MEKGTYEKELIAEKGKKIKRKWHSLVITMELTQNLLRQSPVGDIVQLAN